MHFQNSRQRKVSSKMCGHSEFHTQEWFCKIPIKDLNIFECTVFGIALKILSYLNQFFSIIGLKNIANKVGTVYEVDT